ncbi:MAG: GIY-YIG nuclease family protein [bacterium]|nr:GIY-YIG nuclease family protein [bacterium]
MYYTYVLLCRGKDKDSDMYIGSTRDLSHRVLQHKTKAVDTTKKFDTIELIYYEACSSKKDALKRELQLKTGFGRGYLKRRLEDYLAELV